MSSLLHTLITDLQRFPQPGSPPDHEPPAGRRWSDAPFASWAPGQSSSTASGTGRAPEPAAPAPAAQGHHVRHAHPDRVDDGDSINVHARFGPGLYIGHFGGIVVGADVVAGAWSTLSQGVTIGAGKTGSPTLGDRVYVAPGAKVFGAITSATEA